jgi:transposase
MTSPLVIGADVHRATNTICMMDGQGHEVAARFTIPNNRPGSEALVQAVARQVAAGDCAAIHLAAEATGWYWWHLFQTLDRDPTLQQWPVELYALNPRLTASFTKTYVDRDHTDLSDAFVIADRVRLGRDVPPPFHLEERSFALRLLTRYRQHLVQILAREKAYCLAVIYLKASDYTRLQPFANVFGAASRAVLQEFASLEDIAALPLADLVEFIAVTGKRRFADPTHNAHTLQQVAHNSYALPTALHAPVNLILDFSLQHLAFLERQEQRMNTAIAELVDAIPHTLETIPGIGPVYAAGIIAEIAGIERFGGDERKVAKFAGLKWRRHQSGSFEAEETRLTRTGNRYLRYYVCEAATAVRMPAAEYGAYYDRKYREVRQHQHKRALVLTARKLVRLVVRLLTTNQAYQPRRASG